MTNDTIFVIELNRSIIICEFIDRYQVFCYVRYIVNFIDFNEVPIRKFKMGSPMSKGVFNPIVPKSNRERCSKTL